MKESMTKLKEQTAQMALKAQKDAEAAATAREAADKELTETRAALEAERNKVKSVEVSHCPSLLLLSTSAHHCRQCTAARVPDQECDILACTYIHT